MNSHCYPERSVTITPVIRLLLLIQGLFNRAIFSNPNGNVGFVTSAIETNLALITASAPGPALRPIFRSRDRGGWFAARTVMTTADAVPTTITNMDNIDVELGGGRRRNTVLKAG